MPVDVTAKPYEKYRAIKEICAVEERFPYRGIQMCLPWIGGRFELKQMICCVIGGCKIYEHALNRIFLIK